VREVGLRAALDPLIRQYAAAHDLVIVSKNADFAERALSHGPPPKVVWLRLGNCTTAQVESLLRRHTTDLLAFERDPSPVLILL
jgi:predicted nuclease of predicted toxin-antitoxin system